MQACQNALKKCKHYGFLSPDKLVKAMDHIVGNPSDETDFETFDATIGKCVRQIETMFICKILPRQYQQWAVKLHKELHHIKARVKVKGDIKPKPLESTWERLSGFLDTSTFNTLLAIFYIWLSKVLSGMSPREAYDSYFLCGGDDTISTPIGGESLKITADLLGLRVKIIVNDAKSCTFLGNAYLRDGDGGVIVMSCPRRRLTGLTVGVATDDPLHLLYLKCSSYLAAYGPNAPVLGKLATKVTSLLRSKYVDKEVNYQMEKSLNWMKHVFGHDDYNFKTPDNEYTQAYTVRDFGIDWADLLRIEGEITDAKSLEDLPKRMLAMPTPTFKRDFSMGDVVYSALTDGSKPLDVSVKTPPVAPYKHHEAIRTKKQKNGSKKQNAHKTRKEARKPKEDK